MKRIEEYMHIKITWITVEKEEKKNEQTVVKVKCFQFFLVVFFLFLLSSRRFPNRFACSPFKQHCIARIMVLYKRIYQFSSIFFPAFDDFFLCLHRSYHKETATFEGKKKQQSEKSEPIPKQSKMPR